MLCNWCGDENTSSVWTTHRCREEEENEKH